jgi:hypothetical protein
MAYLICCEYPARPPADGSWQLEVQPTLFWFVTLRFARCSSCLGPCFVVCCCFQRDVVALDTALRYRQAQSSVSQHSTAQHSLCSHSRKHTTHGLEPHSANLPDNTPVVARMHRYVSLWHKCVLLSESFGMSCKYTNRTLKLRHS